jgi:hypothetical protein
MQRAPTLKVCLQHNNEEQRCVRCARRWPGCGIRPIRASQDIASACDRVTPCPRAVWRLLRWRWRSSRLRLRPLRSSQPRVPDHRRQRRLPQPGRQPPLPVPLSLCIQQQVLRNRQRDRQQASRLHSRALSLNQPQIQPLRREVLRPRERRTAASRHATRRHRR